MAKHNVTTMNISLPQSMREFIRRRMEKGGYTNVSEYVRHLVRQDQAGAKTDLEQQLLEGLHSGPGRPVDQAFWKDLDTRLKARRAERKSIKKKAG